jgi:hypothetical protein
MIVSFQKLHRERCVTNILAVDLDFSTRWLRSDLEIQPLSHDLRVRCASRADEKNGSHEGHRNGSENWEGPIHGSCLIRNGTGSSLILFAEIFASFSREAFKMGLLGWSNSIRALQRGLSYSRSKTRAASLPLIGAGKRRDKALPPVKRSNGSAGY